jgi:hypothetical protein
MLDHGRIGMTVCTYDVFLWGEVCLWGLRCVKKSDVEWRERLCGGGNEYIIPTYVRT